MISYFETKVGDARAPEAWRIASWDLSENLQSIAREHGDRTHQSGEPDYVVLFLENIPAAAVPGVASYFVISAGSTRVELLELANGDPRADRESLSYDSAWTESVSQRFRAFRERIQPF